MEFVVFSSFFFRIALAHTHKYIRFHWCILLNMLWDDGSALKLFYRVWKCAKWILVYGIPATFFSVLPIFNCNLCAHTFMANAKKRREEKKKKHEKKITITVAAGWCIYYFMKIINIYCWRSCFECWNGNTTTAHCSILMQKV